MTTFLFETYISYNYIKLYKWAQALSAVNALSLIDSQS